MLLKIQKRDGRIVDFDEERITLAIEKAMRETPKGPERELAIKITKDIKKKVEEDFKASLENNTNKYKTVEDIQDLVEEMLMSSDRKEVARKYIIFRDYRNKTRNMKSAYKMLDDGFISKYKHLKSPFEPLGEFVYYRTYSRWLQEEKRREYWWETIRRAIEFNTTLVPGVSKEEAQKLFDNVFNLRQFISGRTMWVGLTEISKEYGMANYNCAFTVIDDFVKFKELFYLLMIGTGVGFRILKKDVEKLDPIRTKFSLIHDTYSPVSKYKREENTSVNFVKNIAQITIGDSKEGWTQALDLLFRILCDRDYKKVDTIVLNYNNVRPKGEKLKRFGGTASGHESLKAMFEKIKNVLVKVGKEYNSDFCKLRSVHCLDIANIIGENVVVGGVRRTAEIGLLDFDDKECIEAKSGLYYQDDMGNWIENKNISHRKMSNNSIYYYSKPTREKLNWQLKQMRYSGEPAFINVEAAQKRREDFEGVNPCVEILLRDRGLCNLTTVNVMAFVKDGILDEKELMEAQRLSARAGLRMTCLPLELNKWHLTQEQDRLLGCSLTGFQDAMNAIEYSKEQQERLLSTLNKVANEAASDYAKDLKINTPRLVCTIKPEGTISQLPIVSSGVHFSHSPYYIRRVRISSTDPLVKVCEELEYPVLPEVGQDIETCSTKVIEFPVKAPKGKTKYDVTAIEQLEIYKMFQKHYTDHNTSITIHVRNHEWEAVEEWLWNNWDDVVAVSFLSLDDNFYSLLPYESIDENEYMRRVNKMKAFVPSLLSKYETAEIDIDVGSSECINNVCPIR
jgi:ribonucleoside-diphosphate reductase alpha chain/ribonucleoside-triphosphate reductase